MHTKIISMVIAAAALTVGQIAFADSAADAPPQKTVNYADLNLAQTAGAKALFHRLSGAAETVCQPLAGADLGSKQRYQNCIAESLSSAVERVNQPTLTEYAASRGIVTAPWVVTVAKAP